MEPEETNVPLIDQIKEGDIQNIPLDVLAMIVTQYLSQKDIARLCQTSKSFNDTFCNLKTTRISPERFQSIWKQLYQRDISAYQLPTDGRWYQAYRNAVRPFANLSYPEALKDTARKGLEKLIVNEDTREALTENIVLPGVIAEAAAYGGYGDIVDFGLQMRPRGRWDRFPTRVLYELARGGHSDLLMKYIDEIVLTDTEQGDLFTYAIVSGNVDLVRTLFQRFRASPDTLNKSMSIAAIKGDADMFAEIKRFGGVLDNSYDTIIGGNVDLINEAFENQEVDPVLAVSAAIQGGHLDLVNEWYPHLGEERLDDPYITAALGTSNSEPPNSPRLDIIQFLVDKGYPFTGLEVTVSLREAAVRGSLPVIKKLLQIAPKRLPLGSLYGAADAAAVNRYLEVARYLRGYANTQFYRNQILAAIRNEEKGTIKSILGAKSPDIVYYIEEAIHRAIATGNKEIVEIFLKVTPGYPYETINYDSMIKFADSISEDIADLVEEYRQLHQQVAL